MLRTGGMDKALAAGMFVALASASVAARAQTPPRGDKVAAESLFEEGRKLVAAGKYAEACPKFAGSEQLNPSAATLLNLASCWEKTGRAATAWATYHEAASAANAVGRADYVATAQRHADALAPRLAHLTVSVTQPANGLEIKRDDVPVPAAEWGVAIPVDSGTHSLGATAPGYAPWTMAVVVPADGSVVTATVPPLEALPPAPAAQPAPAPPPAVSTAAAATPIAQAPRPASAESRSAPARAPVSESPAGSSGALASPASARAWCSPCSPRRSTTRR